MQISWKIPTILHRNGVIKTLKIVHNATGTSNIEVGTGQTKVYEYIIIVEL